MDKLKFEILKLIRTDNPDIFDILVPRLTGGIGISVNSKKSKLKNSKFGGLPVIEKDFIWPKYAGKPLSFMAQFSISDFNEVGYSSDLPNSGILYFFMLTDLNSQYPNKPGQYYVHYTKKINNIAPYTKSKDISDAITFKEGFMHFYPMYTLRKDNEYNEDLDDAIDDLNTLISETTGHQLDGNHQIGGWPFSLQNPVFSLWAANEHNNNLVKKSHENLFEIEKEYFLLLQLNFGDSTLDFNSYGGNGIAYYGIKRKDLKDLNFNNLKLICQN